MYVPIFQSLVRDAGLWNPLRLRTRRATPSSFNRWCATRGGGTQLLVVQPVHRQILSIASARQGAVELEEIQEETGLSRNFQSLVRDMGWWNTSRAQRDR